MISMLSKTCKMERTTYIRVILTGMRSSGLLTSGSSSDSLNRALEQVAKLQCLNEIAKDVFK